MTSRGSAVQTAIVGLLLAGAIAAAGCARADVYAVTRAPMSDGGRDQGLPLTCSSPVLPAGDTTHTVQVGSVSRTYVLHVPAAYDGKQAVPLVVDFHGIGGSGSSELTGSPYPARLDPEGVIMAFPDGLKGPAGTGWNVGPFVCRVSLESIQAYSFSTSE